MAVCLLLGIAFVARGITDEGAVSLDGDMPHYLMNGVFLHDVIRDMPWRSPLEYAQQYYLRYPTITLGHHPFVPAIAEVPFFSGFGISVFAARLTTAAAFIVLLVFWFKLLEEIYDSSTAFFGSMLLISTPSVVPLFQTALSEPYVLCLIVLSVYSMHRYCVRERGGAAAAFAVCVVLSAYAKQLAVFMFPVYLVQFVSAFGFRRLVRWSTLATIAAIGLCLVPLAALTVKYSLWNVTIVTQFIDPAERTSPSKFLEFARWLWSGQFRLSGPVLVLALIGVAAAAFRRDRRILLFVTWPIAVYACLVVVGVKQDRFFCYWLPPFCALAATTLQLGTSNLQRRSLVLVLSAIVAIQLWTSARDAQMPTTAGVRPTGATGYEEAARYVTEHRRGDTILYSAVVDTGYFVFFVRKHDPQREMIVIRSDKLLTTSRMDTVDFERRINRREEILPLLQRYGVGYVVVENVQYPDGPLQWLQQVVRTSSFDLRRQIPIESRDPRLNGATLSVYEFRDRTPADRDATFTIGIPLINDVIKVRLADLQRRSE